MVWWQVWQRSAQQRRTGWSGHSARGIPDSRVGNPEADGHVAAVVENGLGKLPSIVGDSIDSVKFY